MLLILKAGKQQVTTVSQERSQNSEVAEDMYLKWALDYALREKSEEMYCIPLFEKEIKWALKYLQGNTIKGGERIIQMIWKWWDMRCQAWNFK